MKKTIQSLASTMKRLAKKHNLQLKKIFSNTYYQANDTDVLFCSIHYRVEDLDIIIRTSTNAGIYSIECNTSSISTLEKIIALDKDLIKEKVL